MLDGIDIGSLVSTAGPTGILALVVLLIFTGKLIPRSTVDMSLQRAGEEAQRWRTAYENEAAARALDRETAMKSLEAMQTTVHVVKAFNEIAAENKAGDSK